LPEERAWFDGFLNSGFIDSFRFLNKEPDNYTWWIAFLLQGQVIRGMNRLLFSQRGLERKNKRAIILPEAKHSDHCPVLVEVE
jgi:exodeoxyribonuclease-3